MSLSATSRKAIDIGVPALGAGITALILFSRTKNWKFLLLGAGIAFFIFYILTTQVTKVVITEGPAPVPTGGGCDNYDPKALIDSIYTDCNCYLCSRNHNLYDTLLGLSDCQLRTAYNYYNTVYYPNKGVSLPGLISGQSNFWGSSFGELQKAMADKFNTLNLQ